ncbi:MAG TPA: pyridoxal-dependent decarboxylase [Candidatus Limnocylindrales bacterium]
MTPDKIDNQTAATPSGLDLAQNSGLNDMDAGSFRAAAHQAVDIMADYLEGVRDRDVMPNVEPGTLRPLFPVSPPDAPESMDVILDDYRRLFEPNLTHWQHPRFLAYFASSASGPGIIGEMLTSVLNSNPMLWRTSPVGTELEEVVIDWIRQALGLPPGFDGLITDTASTSTMLALAAARQAAGIDAAAKGLPARDEVPQMRIYCSAEAHSSIEKAAMTLGLGRAGVTKIPVNDAFELRIDALEEAIVADRAAGVKPIALVCTIGTTSTTSRDPVAEMAKIAAREGIWLHVDAAYAGVVAIIPELRDQFAGWELADSIVTNAHKWWFAPVDASILLTRRMPVLRNAFSLVPEYLRTLDRDGPIRDYNEYTPTLGRRLRALKLWMHLRYFGLDGLRRRVANQIAMAVRFAGWIDADPDFERMAPVPFSTVCFRYRPAALADRQEEPSVGDEIDNLNIRLLDSVNRTGKVFISHTKVHGRITLRVAISNLRTEDSDLELVWDVIRQEAGALQEDA